ncbi:ecdysteroid 22-kinase family protein [Shewanella aegiceratis]|uniref:ecdysteroid 22-kinase family protein n=1 Tax=Shewanella aegiceratis TaxID=2864203 RepID=UPI0021AC8F80|nr:ecdysteroid 22-kinase family protein [Shewanella aegiceratis]
MNIEQLLCETLSCEKVIKLGKLQTLWSGYGEIARFMVHYLPKRPQENARDDLINRPASQTVIVKHIAPPTQSCHPHQWDTEVSHQRKMRSYQVELNWYRDFAPRCQGVLNLPQLLAAEQDTVTQEMLLVMSDLDAQGFDQRRINLTQAELYACIEWLARFHAMFAYECADELGYQLANEFAYEASEASPKDHPLEKEFPNAAPYAGLWPIGTYWHLATRPDELEVMTDSPLKRASEVIDARLNQARFQTLVHGDAKVANFCFHKEVESLGVNGMAALDFQYVGAGIGVKDFIYLLGSCLDEAQLVTIYDAACSHYFKSLKQQLSGRWAAEQIEALVAEWSDLLPFAWADFERFLAGWQPEHHKRNGFSQDMTQRALKALG